VFIFLVVTIDMMGVGLAYPLLPKLIQGVGSYTLSEAAFYNGIIAVLYALAQFAFSPLLGNLSDAYGRRPVLLTAQTGLALDYFLMALAPSLWWIAVARFVSGVFGATVSTATAYVADISTPENRARNFGFIGMAFGIGFVIGPFLGGLLGEIDIHLPFLVSGLLVCANVVFGYFVLPESLPKADRRRFSGLRASNPFSALRMLTRLPHLTPYLVCFFLVFMAQRGLESIWVLYADFRFDWGVREAAFSLGFVGLMYIIVQGFLVGKLVSRFGERPVIDAGYLLAAVSLLFFAMADKGWLAVPLIGLFILGAASAEPALKSLSSQAVGKDEQGLLQGAIGSVNSLVIILAPLTANMVLAHVSGPSPLLPLPGAWFYFGAALFLIAWLVFRRSRIRPRKIPD
jgi:DHA1 family tetracycline resistance protein-like MFS transporter